MRKIFEGFQTAHDFAQSESRAKKQILFLCKADIGGVKYTVVDEKEKMFPDEVVFNAYDENGEIKK